MAGELREKELPFRVMVDCSHGNSARDHHRQPLVSAEVAAQVAAGARDIFGVMIESHLVTGRQDLVPGEELTYGQSITDACVSWETTEEMLEEMAAAVRTRRSR